MARSRLFLAPPSRFGEDGEGEWRGGFTAVYGQRHGGEADTEAGARVEGQGDRGGAEGQGEAVGEDAEGEVGEEEAGYAWDAEAGADVETGMFASVVGVGGERWG